jgi:hypothetical protein
VALLVLPLCTRAGFRAGAVAASGANFPPALLISASLALSLVLSPWATAMALDIAGLVTAPSKLRAGVEFDVQYVAISGLHCKLALADVTMLQPVPPP